MYDLNIDGVSLVANYRAQFNKVIRTSSYEALVTTLRSRQAEFFAPAAAASHDLRDGVHGGDLGAKPVR